MRARQSPTKFRDSSLEIDKEGDGIPFGPKVFAQFDRNRNLKKLDSLTSTKDFRKRVVGCLVRSANAIQFRQGVSHLFIELVDFVDLVEVIKFSGNLTFRKVG